MPPIRNLVLADRLQIRSAAQRILSMRVVPYGQAADTGGGTWEMVEAGALEGTDPAAIVLRQDHEDPPAGRGLSLEERSDGAYMDFQVARTPRGDEILANVLEGVHRNASIGFDPAGGVSRRARVQGRAVTVHSRLALQEVSTTWRPVYADAAILAVRSEDLTEMPLETTPDPATTAAAAASTTHVHAPPAIAAVPDPELDGLRARIQELETRARQAVDLPAWTPQARAAAIHRGQWASMALRSISGERIDAMELRALADVVTADNLGVVPEQFRGELIQAEIQRARPFLESTRQVPAGDSGLTINIPVLTQRPLVDKQTAEKAELASRKTIIGTVGFDAITKGGAGDLSLQLLRRSSPSFLALWLDLLGEAYAIDCDDEAVDALLAAAAVIEGGEFDPESPSFGGAFINAMAAGRTLRPDRLWLSTAAMAAFIDAKEPSGGGGAPLYPGLARIAQVTPEGPNGPLPIILQPVHVPALDDEAVDVIVGPSRGFMWAEDGTYTLQADVPSKAGRDVGLVGMVWFMPIHPAAFTTYTLPA